jgi:hypothetical protein
MLASWQSEREFGSYAIRVIFTPNFTTMSLDNIGRKICEGSEASTEEAYQFNENKGSNLRWESCM